MVAEAVKKLVTGGGVMAFILVTLLSAVVLVASLTPVAPWIVLGAVTVAAGVVAYYWPIITDSPMTPLAQMGMVAAVVAPSFVTIFTQDLFWATTCLALVIATILGVEVLTSPTPLNHSPLPTLETLEDDLPEVGCEEMRQAAASWGSRSTTAAIVAALGGVVAVSGSVTWLALAVDPRWLFAVTLTSIVLFCAAGAFKFGSGWKQLVATLAIGAVGGVVALQLLTLAQPAVGDAFTAHLGFEDVSGVISLLISGLVIGVCVAAVVILVDRFLALPVGKIRPGSNAIPLVVGALQFLLAAFPVYVLIRLG